jgi:TonB-dependent SusC/RagA subfamily outer membrane receptor
MARLILSSMLIAAVYITGCVSAETVSSQDQPSNVVLDETYYYRSLSDYLIRVPGVTISGQSVAIRGISSFNAGTEPLFVIDGVPAGNSLAQANNLVNVRDIDHVQVLKGPDAAIYGVRGSNGVILIVTKK